MRSRQALNTYNFPRALQRCFSWPKRANTTNRHQRSDLGVAKHGTKQISPDTAPVPRCQTHIKEQTDGRISQTIFKQQSFNRKRSIFPGISVRHRSACDTPGQNRLALDGTVSTSHFQKMKFKHRRTGRFRQNVTARGKPFNHGFRATGL